MANRKFFSGLPEKMMGRSTGPNRQQTNFYWPDESNAGEDPRMMRSNRMRNRSLSTASIVSQSQASTDTEESRRRRRRDMGSRIEFYDMVDTATDNESVFSSRMDPTRHKKLETLKSRIGFYDYVDTEDPSQMNDDDTNSVIEVSQKKDIQEVRNDKNGIIDTTPIENKNFLSNSKHVDELAQNVNKLSLNAEQTSNKPRYVDSFSESDDDEDYRYQKSYRGQHEPAGRNYQSKNYRRPPLQKQYHPPPPQYQQSRPRRYNSHYFDDYEDDGYDRYFDNASIRSSRARLPLVRAPRRNYSPDISDEEFYDNRVYAKRNGRTSRDYRQAYSPEREYSRGPTARYDEYYESFRDERRQPNNRNSNTNGYGSEMDYNRPKSKTPPRVQPLQRQQSNETESEIKIPPTSARPPIKPVTRSMSINEARRRHHVNLKSNIFHTDDEYNQVVAQRKPLSVRDFAANHRCGVGLPDLE